MDHRWLGTEWRTIMIAIKYGDIVTVSIGPNSAIESGATVCYAVIISDDIVNEHLKSVIVCPVIEAKQLLESRIGATFIPKEKSGMVFDGVVLSLQIKTISKDKILERVGSIPAPYTRQLKESLKAVLALDK
ncbi:MAG: type II toxin-antitoxin system PemK/MazF family toxin [bacterium]